MIELRWKLIRHDPQSSRMTCSTVADLLLRDSVLHDHLRLEDWGLGKAAAAAEEQLVVHENRMTHCCMIVGCIYTAFVLADRSVDSDVVAQNCCTAAADPLEHETAAPHGYHGGIFWSQISHMCGKFSDKTHDGHCMIVVLWLIWIAWVERADRGMRSVQLFVFRTRPLRRSIGFGLSTRRHPKENLPTSC